MKFAKIIAAGALALVASSAAFAAPVKITGSTAFRKALYASIINQGYNQVAYIGTSLDSCNQAIFKKGTNLYIETCMAGSVGGVDWVSNSGNVGTAPGTNLTRAWIDSTATITYAAAATGASPTFTITGGSPIAANNGATPAAIFATGNPSTADIAMSDSFQTSTKFNTNPMTDSQGGVGVVSFVFAKGLKHPDITQAAYDRFTNVSALAFQNLAANGTAPLEMFTGNTADAAIDVVLTGRDNDSGTRLATNFETGYGNVDTFMFQYKFLQGATDAGSATGLTINTLTAFNLGTGQAGYASGGSVKNVLKNAIASGTLSDNGHPFIILGYVGIGDTPGAAQQLSYNGATLDAAGNTVNFGNYTFWTAEHLYYRPGNANSAVADAIALSMQTTYATASGLLIPTTVLRAGEGQVVNPNY